MSDLTKDLVVSFPRDVARGFQWKTRDDERMAPSEMRTSHLFFTLRMIWNNCVPNKCRVGRVKLYAFGPHYTASYIREAVVALGAELADRPDLTTGMRAELAQMAAHFHVEPKLIENHMRQAS